MLGAALFWMSLWSLAVVGALNFYLPSLVIIALVLNLAWTSEIMRNVVNISVSRVVALYYLRGMQSSTKFGFLRAMIRNLGSACLGSLFVPAIEATRVVARFLNLVKGEDEFLFCCARCCFRVMESIFRYGNGWAYVQTRIAMALPHACVSCYYVCYVENPDNKLFDTTIKDSLDMVKSGHHAAVATSPLPRRFASD
ncbi:protein PNS1-like isoform X3 [Arachis hypogaea]|uniref:protein PNS1-like isoform X3 n=1 Tax=Arachis hypogaea TaxID=3818 RepID=UPI003B21752E|nr:hypothetical protein DS421_3g69240 [Arachis hypogaea]